MSYLAHHETERNIDVITTIIIYDFYRASAIGRKADCLKRCLSVGQDATRAQGHGDPQRFNSLCASVCVAMHQLLGDSRI